MSNKKDLFGDRMKSYEDVETNRVSMPLLPLMIRLDGKCFSGFTKGLNRPYDKRMSKCMLKLTKYIAKESGAKLAYTQSDEISLLLMQSSHLEQLYYGGKFFKLTSVLASTATAYFNRLIKKYLPKEYYKKMPLFDCRCWNVPSLSEAMNCFLWREKDATKNSIQMLAREHFSNKQLHGKKCNEMLELMESKQVYWDKLPSFLDMVFIYIELL